MLLWRWFNDGFKNVFLMIIECCVKSQLENHDDLFKGDAMVIERTFSGIDWGYKGDLMEFFSDLIGMQWRFHRYPLDIQLWLNGIERGYHRDTMEQKKQQGCPRTPRYGRTGLKNTTCPPCKHRFTCLAYHGLE